MINGNGINGGETTVKTLRTGLAALMLMLGVPGLAAAEDPRELVAMPPDVRDSLLMNMQDHLIALDTILSHIAQERFTEAARVADQRLRVLTNSEGEGNITRWFPPEMLTARDQLREAASRFSRAADRANREHDYASMRELSWAVSDITSACTGCHSHYRVR